MPQDVPVRPHLVDHKVNNFQELIRSFRLRKKMTQRQLSKKIGTYVSKCGASLICVYESGFILPSIKNIYNLSEVLEVNKEALFEMVLKEHYERFVKAHMNSYFIYAKNGIEKQRKDSRYMMCPSSTRDLEKSYKFTYFPIILKKIQKEKGKSRSNFANELISAIKYRRYSQKYIIDIIRGHKCPSPRLVISICKYLGLDAYSVYSVIVKEKAVFHLKNMRKEWEIYKNRIRTVKKDE